jgi:hypothetical protein
MATIKSKYKPELKDTKQMQTELKQKDGGDSINGQNTGGKKHG